MKINKTKKQIIPLAYPYYFFTVLLIALVGIFDSIYLALSHFRVYTDIGYESFCAISRSMNCDTVSQSPYSIFLGVPVPIWGIIGYAIFLCFLFYAGSPGALKKRIWTLLFVIALIFSGYSIILAVISTFFIHSYCIMCIFSYAVNLLLLYFTWITGKRFECEPLFKALLLDIRYLLGHLRTIIPGALFFCITIFMLILFFPAYWQMNQAALSKDTATGITEDGHPWIGAENPTLEIVEFSDYRCFQCKKMHYFLRSFIQAHPDEIRLIHRHFPMDHIINPIVKEPFHIGAAHLAVVAIFAMQKGKFWEMNDALFNISRQTETIDLRDLAEQAGIEYDKIKDVFKDQESVKLLKNDVRAGLKYGLTGTPGFVINGKVYEGQIPPQVFNDSGLSKPSGFLKSEKGAE